MTSRICRLSGCEHEALKADSLCRLHYLAQTYKEIRREREADAKAQKAFNWEMGIDENDEW